MKKILTKTALVGAVGLAAFSSQKVSAADEVQVDANVSSSESSSTSSGVSAPNDTLNITGSATPAENNTNNSDVPATTTTVKENENVGPGYYTSNNSTVAAVTTKSYLLKSSESFIAGIKSGLISGWEKYGVLPSVSAAQAILESGWGSSGLAIYGNNLFGIKGTYNGAYVTMPTQEYINGQWITIDAQFRKYPSWNESVEDHGYFLASNSRYSNLLGVTDYKKVTSLLQQDGYATAPTYAAALNTIIEQNNLTAIDNEAINKISDAGSLDNAIVKDGKLNVNGWHISKDAAGKNNSYLFLMNADSKTEYKRYKIQRTQRTDVASAYSQVANALNSGFSQEIALDADMYGKSFYLMSRYSGAADGNSNNVDYTFEQKIDIPEVTNSSLDSSSASQSQINLHGWHATSFSRKSKSSYIILIDRETGVEAKRYKINRSSRPDVQDAYSYILNAGTSGFDTTIPVTADMKGKSYQVISRYSTQDDGEGETNDVKFAQEIKVPGKQAQSKSSLDSAWMDASNLHVEGWHATDFSVEKPYHTLIVMDAATNTELARQSIQNTQRSDVQKAYPDIANSLNSGINTNIKITSKMSGKKVYIVSRYSKTKAADSDYVDLKLSGTITPTSSGSTDTNLAALDDFAKAGNTLLLKGWHATNNAQGRKYHYLFIMDRSTNLEIGRVKVSNVNRADVGNAYPWIYQANQSGFSTQINISNQMRGKNVYLMSRYTSDPAGNNDAVDYRFGSTLHL